MNIDLANKTEQSTGGGGYFRLRIAFLTQLAFAPNRDPDNKALITDSVVFKPGEDWIEIYSDSKKFKITEEPSEASGNNGYTSTIEAYLPGENWKLRQFINEGHSAEDGIVLIDNCSEQASYMQGFGLCCMATMKFSFDSGQKSSEDKGWAFKSVSEQDGVIAVYQGAGSLQSIVKVPVDDTTPDVSAGTATYLLPENGGVNEITALDNAVTGSLIQLKWNSATNHSTITSGATFMLSAAFTPEPDAVLILKAVTAGTFAEVYRYLPSA